MEWILPDVLINFKYNAEVFWPLKILQDAKVRTSQKVTIGTTNLKSLGTIWNP